jgi:hypothetical protein
LFPNHRGQCSRKWAVVSVAPHWQNGEFTMFLRNKWWLPSSVQLWNKQRENIKSSRSVQIIKSNLQPQNNTKPIYYYIGTRLGQILHARLRMQCSSLNHHLFRKNIVNSPFCQCRATETTTCLSCVNMVKRWIVYNLWWTSARLRIYLYLGYSLSL